MNITNDYRRELKSKIIEYAMNEFRQRGIKAVKMDEISRGLHVSKRTVYEIFGDKEELLLAGLKIKNLEMREKLEAYSCNGAHNVVDIIGYFYKLQMEVNSMVGVTFYEEIHRMPRVVEFFGDKEELLLAGIRAQDEELRRMLDQFASENNHNVIDIICYFYRVQMELCEQVGVKFYEEIQHMPRVVAYMKSVHEHEVEDRMRFYECGVKEGLFLSDIDYPFISNVGHITMNEIMHLQLYRMYSMQTIFDNFFMVIVRGICTERGLELLNRGMGHA